MGGEREFGPGGRGQMRMPECLTRESIGIGSFFFFLGPGIFIVGSVN